MSHKGADINTVDDKTWRGIQDRALKANPQLSDTFSDEAARRRTQDRDSYDKREQN